MSYISKLMVFALLTIWSNLIFSAVNLNVKIGQLINNQLVEVNKNFSAEFNKEIVIQDDSLKDRIVLSLKKIKNVLVNGKRLSPVQINLKTVNNEKKISGKTQTVTSFYKNEANFKVASADNSNDFDIQLEFSEVN